MKFGKEFASQMVPEWQPTYMDYNYLKSLLKDILNNRKRKITSESISETPRKRSLKRRLSLYRAFSGLRNQAGSPSRKGSPNNEEEVILVSQVQQENTEVSEGRYQTMFLMSTDEGGEKELVFFRRLDDEFNKVLKFYKENVNEVNTEAEELAKQMDALIALRIKVDYPLTEYLNQGDSNGSTVLSHDKSSPPKSATPPSPDGTNQGRARMDTIREAETSSEGILEVEMRPMSHQQPKTNTNTHKEGFTLPPLRILGQVKINVDPETPVSTLKNVFTSSKSDLSFSKEELKKAEERLKQAFVVFHGKLLLLKSYSFLNLLAFSKIMKKYDKITSRKASKSYLQMVKNSYLGNSEEVTILTERVEATFIKHFANGNQREGMKLLRPQAKRERHRVTFFTGLLLGCSIALVAAIIVTLHARNLLDNAEGHNQYMENIFPLYTLFGYIVLHMILFAGNICLWRRFRVNYPFIFGFKEGKGSMGYREILLVASGLSVLTLAAVLSNLDMEMEPKTKSFQTLTELVPLGLVIVVLLILFCPLNIIFRSSRFFFIRTSWRSLCAPLYKVTLPDFFLADQFTSQVQALRCLQFYVCYYGWGDFKKRSNKCQRNEIYQIFYIVIAIVPYWARFLQCLRRRLEEGNHKEMFNALRYLSTVVALVMRTLYDLKRRPFWKIMAATSSGVTTVTNTYWDIVVDWGLLRRTSKNPWLRDKLIIPHKKVYFVVMVVNILLRLVWMQLVLDFQETAFLHRKAMVAIVACLEILRRCIWNFFRLENEHLNNVGRYRAFKSVPLPFYYDDTRRI